MSVGNYHKLKIWQISMPSNIAEGNVRDSRKEYLHFLSVALGSLAEVETQLQLSSRLGFVSLDEIEEMLELIQQLARMIRGLQRNIKSKIS
ncbi:MAG: four helix bundle protein [Gammaproteobacteria bacterium]